MRKDNILETFKADLSSAKNLRNKLQEKIEKMEKRV